MYIRHDKYIQICRPNTVLIKNSGFFPFIFMDWVSAFHFDFFCFLEFTFSSVVSFIWFINVSHVLNRNDRFCCTFDTENQKHILNQSKWSSQVSLHSVSYDINVSHSFEAILNLDAVTVRNTWIKGKNQTQKRTELTKINWQFSKKLN